jgi:hypothetical protein
MEALNATKAMGLFERSNPGEEALFPTVCISSGAMRRLSSVPSLEISLGRQGWQQEPHLIGISKWDNPTKVLDN